jgi:hypothetical protein
MISGGVPRTVIRSFSIALLIAGALPPVHAAGRRGRHSPDRQGQTEPAAPPVTSSTSVSSRITITMPAADAQLFADGQPVEGVGRGRQEAPRPLRLFRELDWLNSRVDFTS